MVDGVANDFAELNVGQNTDRRVSFPVSQTEVPNTQALKLDLNSPNDPDLRLGQRRQRDIRIGVQSLLSQVTATIKVRILTAGEVISRVARLLQRARINKDRRRLNSTRHLTRRYSRPGPVSKGAFLDAACPRRLLALFRCRRLRLPASALYRLTTLSRQGLLPCQQQPLHRRTTGRPRPT